MRHFDAMIYLGQSPTTGSKRGDSLTSLSARRVRSVRVTSVIARIAINGLIVIAASGIGHALSHPARDHSRQAAQVVTSLAGGGATLDDVPENFKDELGYQPVATGETLVNPNGGCSTPGGIGPDSFTTACRVHDFGYDMLRYAEGTGTRLGARARFELDRRLYVDLLRACDTLTCPATATVYYTAVTANSIRQGYVAPATEPTTPWAGIGIGVVGLAMVTAPTNGSGGATDGGGNENRTARQMPEGASDSRWYPEADPSLECSFRAKRRSFPDEERGNGFGSHDADAWHR